MNLVEKPAFPDIFQLARGKTTPPNTHSSPRNPVWYLRISNAVPSRLFLRYVSDLMLFHQPFKLVLKYHAKLLFMTFIYPSHRFSRAVDTGIAVAFHIHIFLPLLLLSSPEQPILYHILTHIFKGFLSTTSMWVLEHIFNFINQGTTFDISMQFWHNILVFFLSFNFTKKRKQISKIQTTKMPFPGNQTSI